MRVLPLKEAKPLKAASPILFRHAALLLGGLLWAFYMLGIPGVPFHPDESTQLWMSSDLRTRFSDPSGFAWQPARSVDNAQRYRLIDPPLTRYVLEIGRGAAGLPAPRSDWDWAKTWEENRAAGALPDERMLHISRGVLGLFFPLDLLLIYQIGKRLLNPLTGILAMAFFGLNALVLLHTRRAMAEALAVCGVLFVVWCFVELKSRDCIFGLALAGVVNAKQTGLALVPVGLLAVMLPGSENRSNLTPSGLCRLAWSWVRISAVLAWVTLALNPVFWADPVRSIQAAWDERKTLANQMQTDYGLGGDSNSFSRPAQRLGALIANLFFTRPAFSETANYTSQTLAAEQVYLANPVHRLLRGAPAGGIFLGLTWVGMAFAILEIVRANGCRRGDILILLASTIALGGAIAWLCPLPWQRYVLPLVPLTCLWSAYALSSIISLVRA